jgi:hypothetical protein
LEELKKDKLRWAGGGGLLASGRRLQMPVDNPSPQLDLHAFSSLHGHDEALQ